MLEVTQLFQKEVENLFKNELDSKDNSPKNNKGGADYLAPKRGSNQTHY
jgi:hypothetical protein